MAIVLRWQVPDSTELAYDLVYIERATSQGGSYSVLTNQAISDNTYVDETGSSASWYRLRFYNSSTTNYSSYSSEMQGSTYIGYCSLNNVREICNLTTSDISDTDLYALITKATIKINSEINTRVTRERVLPIDLTRENEINGVNTVYYVQNWKGNYLGDRDNDGDVDIYDVKVYQVASDGTETQPAVSSVDADDCKITLDSAPSSGVELYLSYDYSPFSMDEPDQQIRLACAQLTAAFAFNKLQRGLSPDQTFGNTKFKRDMEAGNSYYKDYKESITNILSAMGDYSTAEVF